MKLIGIVFILTSTAWMGLRIAGGCRGNIRLLQHLLQALQTMRNEIAFCGTPLPRVFRILEDHTQGELSRIFAGMAACMERDQTVTPLEALRMQPEGKCRLATPLLLELCDQLGAYDLEAQLAGIGRVRARTEMLLSELEQQRTKQGRAYESLGICAGLALAILLL